MAVLQLGTVLVGLSDAVAERNVQVQSYGIIRGGIIEGILQSARQVRGDSGRVSWGHQSRKTSTGVETYQGEGGQESIARGFPADLAVHQINVGFEQFRTILQALCDQVRQRGNGFGDRGLHAIGRKNRHFSQPRIVEAFS